MTSDESDQRGGEQRDDRLTAIERRLAALEARVGQARPVATAAGAADAAAGGAAEEGDTFWALDGLRARYPEDGGVLFTGSVTLPTGGEVQWQHGTLTADVLDPDWADHADTIAALGHPVRLRLLQRALRAPATAHELTEVDGVGSSGQVYHHLRQLTAAGWLRAVGGGRHEIPAARIVPLLVVLAAVAP